MNSPYFKYTLENGKVIEEREPEAHGDGSMTFYYSDGTYCHMPTEEVQAMKERQAWAKKMIKEAGFERKKL